jgi:hypothetical protein
VVVEEEFTARALTKLFLCSSKKEAAIVHVLGRNREMVAKRTYQQKCELDVNVLANVIASQPMHVKL